MATVNEKMTALADEVRTLSGTTTKKSLDTMTTDINAVNTEISEQMDLIQQITTALEGKTSSGVTLPSLDNPASASTIINGYEAIDSNGNVITGTMPIITDPTAPIITVDETGTIVSSVVYNHGYIVGTDRTVTHQLSSDDNGNFIPENIKSGVSIFGVTGTHSGGGFITNKLSGATIDATSLGANTTEVIHTYVSSKPIVAYIMGNWGSGVPTGSSIHSELAIGNALMSIAQSDNDNSVNVSIKTLPGYHQGFHSVERYFIMISDDADAELDYFTIKYPIYACYIKDTKILLSDGTTKPVQDITYEDDLLVWDFDNGCYFSAKPLWIKKPEIAHYYYRCTFENGIELGLVGSDGNCHAVYCLDDNKFEYANNCVDKMVMTEKGASRLLSCDRIDEDVEFYNITTDYHINCYANNVLTSTKLNNIYPMKNMKFVKEIREPIPYDKFSDIPVEFYKGLRLCEHKPENIDQIIDNVKLKVSTMLPKIKEV